MEQLKQILLASLELIWSQRHLWAVQPDWYKRLVALGVPAIALVLTGIALANRYYSKDSAAIQRGVEMKERLAGVIKSNPTFSVAPGQHGSLPRLADNEDAILVIGPTATSLDAGVDEQQQVVVTPARTMHVAVLIPFQDGSWAERSTTRFETDVDPFSVLSRPEYKARLQRAQHLVCLGMASRSIPDASAEIIQANEERSRSRAKNLCLVAAQSAGQGRTYWSLPLGYATVAAPSPVSQLAQRRAVIVGVRDTQSESDVRTALALVLAQTKVRDVNLSGYSMSSRVELREQKYIWGKGSSELDERVDPANPE